MSISQKSQFRLVVTDGYTINPGDLDWYRLSHSTQEFLAGIDPETRELVRLRFEEDRSQDDTARCMGVSRRRVRTLEARGMTRLRRHLGRAGLLRDGGRSGAE